MWYLFFRLILIIFGSGILSCRLSLLYNFVLIPSIPITNLYIIIMSILLLTSDMENYNILTLSSDMSFFKLGTHSLPLLFFNLLMYFVHSWLQTSIAFQTAVLVNYVINFRMTFSIVHLISPSR